MKHAVRLSLLPLVLMLLVAACQDRPQPAAPDGIDALVSDGANGTGGNPDFFFLPPLVADPSHSPDFEPGEFNGQLRPVMAVFRGSDPCSLGNPKVYGPVVVPVNLTLEMYQVDWKTTNLVAGRLYRLCIFGSANGKGLGFVDLTPVTSGLKNLKTGQVVQFQQGSTIPVKFRIEHGALSYDPANPGAGAVATEFTVDQTGGSVILPSESGDTLLAAVSVPANAVPQGAAVTIIVATEAPRYSGKCLPDAPNQSNWCYQFRTEPAPFQFDSLVRVEICVDPDPVAPPLRDLLQVHKYNTTEGLKRLPWAEPTLIGPDCAGSGIALDGRAPQPTTDGLLQRVVHWAGRLLAPREAHAAVLLAGTPPKGIGGLGGSFSDFGGAVTTCTSVEGLAQTYCSALVQLYMATDGTNWTSHTNWLETDNFCTWYGVTCISGWPMYLALGDNNLTGVLPATLGDLDSLQRLYLWNNHLSGPLPATLGNLSNLQEFLADRNQLSDTIPAQLGNLSALRTLFLHSNRFSGPIPPELGNLSQLQYLSLNDNQLVGSIPQELGRLGNLQGLLLQLNYLDGVVPLAVAQLAGLLDTYTVGGCDFLPGNTGLRLGDSPEYRAADLDGDGFICGLPLTPLVFTRVSTGYEFTCGLAADSTAYCWGWNQSGQLGDGTTTSRLTPGAVHMPAGEKFTGMAVGGAHACGLTPEGRAYCWGENGAGRLGDGTMVNRTEPVAVQSGGVMFESIIAGSGHTCGLTASHEVYCWGYNLNGGLGDGTTTDRPLPVAVATPTGVTFASLHGGGDEHTCALTPAGEAYCWGSNSLGQLGDGSTTNRLTPVQVSSGGLTFETLAPGSGHTCGLTDTGVAYCWGWNTHGQLGNGSTYPNQLQPTAVSGGMTFTALEGGGWHTCALRSGSAYCWGSNYYGQVGNDGTTDELTPVSVHMPAGVTFGSLDLGGYQSCALTPAGAAFCWGDNWSGKLGEGTTINRSAPVPVR